MMPLDSLHKFAAQVDELKKAVDDAIAHAAAPHAEGAHAVAPTAIDFQQLIALVMQLLPIIIALFQPKPKPPVPTPPG